MYTYIYTHKHDTERTHSETVPVDGAAGYAAQRGLMYVYVYMYVYVCIYTHYIYKCVCVCMYTNTHLKTVPVDGAA